MLKKILYVILFLVVTYLVLCLVGPKKMDVTTTKTIQASPSAVYAQIADLRNMKNWSKWIKEDTAMELTWGKTTAGIGGTYSWKSEKSGAGSMTIKSAEQDKMIAYDLNFKDWDATSDVKMELKPNGTGTDVTWTMVDQKESPFYMRGMMFIMNMNGMIKKDFDKGLSNLEEYLKANPNTALMNGFNIIDGKFPANDYLATTRAKVKFQDMTNYFATHFGEIAKLAGPAIKGAPCGIYWNYDEKNMVADMSAAMPVSDKTLKGTGYSVISVPESRELLLNYYGSYDNMKAAYEALDTLGKMKGFAYPHMVIEEYVTDPMTEKDTAKWLTKIHYLIK